MTCSGRFASAEDFVSFFCSDSRISRVHDGAANAAALTDTMARFRSKGVEAGKGMILYNLTDGSEGPVTAAEETSLTATLTGGTDNDWDVGDQYLIVTVDAFERASIEHYLDITASDVQASMAAQGMCDCSLSTWGEQLAKKLNIVDAASFYQCGCMVKLTAEERQQYRTWMSEQLTLIRQGKVDLCSGGGGGSEAPAFGSVKEAITPWATAQILSDRAARNDN